VEPHGDGGHLPRQVLQPGQVAAAQYRGRAAQERRRPVRGQVKRVCPLAQVSRRHSTPSSPCPSPHRLALCLDSVDFLYCHLWLTREFHQAIENTWLASDSSAEVGKKIAPQNLGTSP
jgi:hypothetical protein